VLSGDIRNLGAMSPARRLLPLVVLLLATAACSSGGAEPRAWAGSVCAALAPWRAEIAALTGRAQQQITPQTTPGQAKERLVALLGGVEAASETARGKVAAAGVPDVDDGDKIAGRFTASLVAARDAYAHARATVAALDPGDPKRFYDAVGAAFDKLNSEYSASALDTRNVGSTELQKAFAEVPECR
jgi:hypothetical protein